MRIRASVKCVILPASNNAERRYIAVERPLSLLFMSRYFHRPVPDEMSICFKVDPKNALDLATIRGPVEAVEEAATDYSFRVVFVTAAGPDFCSGRL
jgi:hypothetical protein